MSIVTLNSDTWVTAEVAKPGKILTRTNPRPPTISYFRQCRSDPNQAGPINANEYIVSRLGIEMALPMAKIDFINHEGLLGTISFLVATDSQSWSNFPFPNDFEQYLNNLQQVADMIVFDTWIQNTDRNQENLMNVRNIFTKKYDLYFIDNTESLYGSAKPTSKNINDFNADSALKIDSFRKLLKNDFAFFEPSVARIEAIQDVTIDNIIEEVPPEFIVLLIACMTNSLHTLRKKKLMLIQGFQPCRMHRITTLSRLITF